MFIDTERSATLSIFADRLRVPAVAAPLFIISGPDLVIAQCKAGVVGSFPALNARPKELLDEWLDRITRELAEHDRQHPEAPSAPFAVNQMVHRSNERLDADMLLCEKYKVPIVITSMGARPDVNKAVHGWGGIVLHDVINNRFAHSAIDKGADGLIAVAAGAGGNAGSTSPFALIQEIRDWFGGPLLLSGSIATGRSILAAQAMGADMAYIGSAFIATREAAAADGYKQMIVDSTSEDIQYTNAITGVWANYLRPSLVRAGLDPQNLPLGDPTKLDLKAHRHVGGGPKAWRDIWGSGQGIGTVDKVIGAAELIERLTIEYQTARKDWLAALHNGARAGLRSAPQRALA
jgi:nitronate monooxygenase